VGITNDLKRRLLEHETGEEERSYTASRRPLKLVWFEEHKYVDKAIARKKQIKGWSRIKKEALIRKREVELPWLSLNSEERNSLEEDIKYVILSATNSTEESGF
jgi:putative endonuclease